MDKKTISPEQINEALMFLDDALQRSQINFLLLKETAKQVKETKLGITPDLHLNAITAGIQKRHLTDFTYPTLKSILKAARLEANYTDSSIQFTYKEIPIYIKVIRRKYAFFQNPDKAFYRVTEFDLPNPFDRYWTARNIIV